MVQANKIEEHDKIIVVPKTREAPKRGIGSVLFCKMQQIKDAIGQVDAFTGERETYGSMLQRSIRVAIALREKGIKSGDILSICSHNHMDVYIPLLAGFFLNCKFANLDPTLPVQDIVHLLKQVQPKIIFAGPEAVDLNEKCISQLKINTKIVVFGETNKYETFKSFYEESRAEEETFKPVEINDVKETAIIFFSSGTTGLPKGICISHYALISQGYQAINVVQSKESTALMCSSLYWCSGTLTILAAVLTECKFIIYSEFNPATIWEVVTKNKVSVLALAASRMLATCRANPPKDGAPSVKVVIITGTTMTSKQMEFVKSILPNVLLINTYGLSEICGASLIFKPYVTKHIEYALTKENSCGTVAAGFSYKIVDPETEEILGPNQKGELRLKSDFVMNGYYNIDSSACFDSEGFLKTGDVAYYDKDLCFYIVDRIKEIFKYQCYHIIPTRLEEVLLTHKAVKAALVVPKRHEDDGNHPVGVVELYANANPVPTPEELQQYVAERVDHRQQLRGGVKIVDKIPITPSGKMRRRDIIKMIEENTI